jgi:hypothetical protein
MSSETIKHNLNNLLSSKYEPKSDVYSTNLNKDFLNISNPSLINDKVFNSNQKPNISKSNLNTEKAFLNNKRKRYLNNKPSDQINRIGNNEPLLNLSPTAEFYDKSKALVFEKNKPLNINHMEYTNKKNESKALNSNLSQVRLNNMSHIEFKSSYFNNNIIPVLSFKITTEITSKSNWNNNKK